MQCRVDALSPLATIFWSGTTCLAFGQSRLSTGWKGRHWLNDSSANVYVFFTAMVSAEDAVGGFGRKFTSIPGVVEAT